MSLSIIFKTHSGLLVSSLFFIAALLLPPLSLAATTHDVAVGNNTFSPNDLTIEVGDTVRWTNSSGRTHDVTADDGSFASTTSSSFTYSRTFTNIEEILYYCSVHSSAGRDRNTFMNGRINVVAATVSTDVSVESVDALGDSQQAGEDFTVKTTLKNNGPGDSGGFNISFYASTDNVITSGDTLLGTEVVSDISAGASKNIEESVDLPLDLASGDYFIGAIIDLDDNNLNNNANVDETSIFVFQVFTMNPGLNDGWYDRDTDGQGFFITVFPDLGFVSMAWFTYDTELPTEDATANLGDPGHRWLLAVGSFTGNKAILQIEMTSGGIFDTPTDIDRTDPPGSDGSIILTFDNCNSGTVEYDIASINQQGIVPIRRVADDNIVICIALLKESQPDQQP
jgi:plastocyanin